MGRASTTDRSCFYQLRQLHSVRRSLTIDAQHTLVSAFIASRVDYCNAVLYVSLQKSPRRLQMVLNAAARLVSCSIVSMVMALPTSKMSACRCWILLLGALSIRLSVVTYLFLEQEQ